MSFQDDIADDVATVFFDADDLGQTVQHRARDGVTVTDTDIVAVVLVIPGDEFEDNRGRWVRTRKRVAAPATDWTPTTRSKVVIDDLEYDVVTVETDAVGATTYADCERVEQINRGGVRR